MIYWVCQTVQQQDLSEQLSWCGPQALEHSSLTLQKHVYLTTKDPKQVKRLQKYLSAIVCVHSSNISNIFQFHGLPLEQALPPPLAIHLSWSGKISGRVMGLKSTTIPNLKESSDFKHLMSSVQLKENQTGWNFSDAMSFPWGKQHGNLFSSPSKARMLCNSSISSCTQLLPGPFNLYSLGFGTLIDS